VSTFLTAIVLWLSANFGLPAVHEHPRIEFVPASQITAFRYRGFSGAGPTSGMPGQVGPSETVSVYDDATRTIYLPDDWTDRTPEQLSVLVHEMVHHLQNVGKLKFECPQERERLAYAAQERWLGLFDRSLETAFEIDPFTLLVRTRCIH
jgi:hypothetical protein